MSDSEHIYEVRQTTDRCQGLFATRDIEVGELIIQEEPLFTASSPTAIVAAVNRLTTDQLAVFNALTDVYNPDVPSSVTIFKTNALPLGVDSSEGGLFPICSRINTHCSPNVHHSWNEDLGSRGMETVYAVFPIKAGQEILTTYVHPAATRSDRQKKFAAQFNFQCRCSTCSGPKNPASDIRREKISQLDDTILRISLRDPVAGYKLAKERLRLLDEEELADHTEKGRTHYDAFQCCIGSSDFGAAERHTSLAYGVALLCEGLKGENTNIYKCYYTMPTVHPASGTKKSGKMPKLCDPCGCVAKVTCLGCGYGLYCDAECRRSNAKSHGPVCRVIQTMEDRKTTIARMSRLLG